MAASIEREVKLLAPVDFRPPSMNGVVPGLTEAPPVHLELDAVYYDTADLALARAGVTVRYRTGESGPPWTVKLPDRIDGSLLRRLEARFDGEARSVPVAARDLVRAYARSRRLQRVARLHTVRTCVPLLDSDGNSAAELVHDVVSIFDGRRETGSFHEVEVELTGARGKGKLRRAAVKRLSTAGCQAVPPQPKLVRALGAGATAQADLVVEPLGTKPDVAELIRHALSASADRLIRHDPGVRLGEDPEDVHQLRVAARTLRSNLKTFAPVLDRAWADVLRAELGWLGSEAGRARDLDVLDARLHTRTTGLTDEDAAGVQMLLERLKEEQAAARAAMLAALRCRRYDSVLTALVEAAAAPVFNADEPHLAESSARSFVRTAARVQVRRLRRTVAAISAPPSDAELHLVRIRAKRARYAIEAARPVIGEPAARHAAALAHLQDVLGDLHDSIVAVQWLRAAAAARPGCGVVAGQLIGQERGEQRRLRAQVHDAWLLANADGAGAWLGAL